MQTKAERMTSLDGTRMVGFLVYSNEVLDWPSVEEQLSKEHRGMLNSLGKRTLAYFPQTSTTEERAEHGYLFADQWVWTSSASRSIAPV